MTNRTAPADLPQDGIDAYPWYLWLERRYGDQVARRIIHETLATFLERSGQWLTNEATHKAFEVETRRKALEEAIRDVHSSIAGWLSKQAIEERLRALIPKP